MMDWSVGVVTSVAAISALLIGFAMGRGSVATACKDFGAFKESNQRYVCSVDGAVK